MSTASLLWSVLFGALGCGYLAYGRRQRATVAALCGVGLIVLPYVVSNALAMVAAGAALAALPFVAGR